MSASSSDPITAIAGELGETRRSRRSITPGVHVTLEMQDLGRLSFEVR